MSLALVTLLVAALLPVLLQQAVLSGRRQALRREWRALPEEFPAEARRGYKAAQVLVREDGSALFAGVTVGGYYRAESRAVCSRRGCPAPALDCGCGFYAFKTRDAAIDLLHEVLPHIGARHKALLTVDLAGTVLQYEKGYRAERQLVMSVEFERRCTECSRDGVASRATCLATDESATRPFFPPRHAFLRSIVGLPVRPVCDRHLQPGARSVTPAELAGHLGTEVRWLSPA